MLSNTIFPLMQNVFQVCSSAGHRHIHYYSLVSPTVASHILKTFHTEIHPLCLSLSKHLVFWLTSFKSVSQIAYSRIFVQPEPTRARVLPSVKQYNSKILPRIIHSTLFKMEGINNEANSCHVLSTQAPESTRHKCNQLLPVHPLGNT